MIIKHWLTKKEKKYHDLWNNIQKSNLETQKIYKKNTKIIDPSENFLSVLDVSDLIITDESSVAYEGLIRNVPTLSVKDWFIARHNKGVARLVKPSNVTFKTTRKDLNKKIIEILGNNSYKKKIKVNLKKEISYLGSSSRIIVKLLKQFLIDRKLPQKTQYFIKPKVKKNFKKFNNVKLL